MTKREETQNKYTLELAVVFYSCSSVNTTVFYSSSSVNTTVSDSRFSVQGMRRQVKEVLLVNGLVETPIRISSHFS